MEIEFDFSQYNLEDLEDVGDIRYLLEDDMPGLQMRGWPGWGNRPGRSGYDLIDLTAEWGQMQSRMVKYLFQAELYENDLLYVIAYWLFAPFLVHQLIGYMLIPVSFFLQLYIEQGLFGVLIMGAYFGIYVLLYWVDVNYINAEFEIEE